MLIPLNTIRSYFILCERIKGCNSALYAVMCVALWCIHLHIFIREKKQPSIDLLIISIPLMISIKELVNYTSNIKCNKILQLLVCVKCTVCGENLETLGTRICL